MHSAVVRVLFSFLVPGGLVLTATWVVLHLNLLKGALPQLADIYLYVVAVVGGLFGWRFNRSRLVFAIITVVMAHRALQWFSPGSPLSNGPARTVFDAVPFLLPMNLAIFSLWKERGLVTMRGFVRLGWLALQVLAVFLVCKYQRWDWASYLHAEFLKIPALSVVPMTQPTAIAFAVAFVLAALQFVRRRGTIESGFFWALVSVLFAFLEGPSEPASTVYFATAGLVLVVSAVESSHRMAFRDELTGLPARRALEEALLQLGNTYSVAMLDIDHFKQFNDKFGHHVGDQVLRMVGSRLAKVAGGGKPFRYGGEEFSVIFPGKAADETLPYLERLRKAVAESSFVVRHRDRRGNEANGRKSGKRSPKEVAVTISIGVADRNDNSATPQEVIKAADTALYRAKKGGRNQVRV